MSANLMRRRALILVLPLALGGCMVDDWVTDFRQQPSLGTWQQVTADSAGMLVPSRGNPQGSVPVTGTTLAAWQVSYAAMPGTVDSMSSLTNPVAVDPRSLENGRKQYQVNCAVCHGEVGDANSTLKQVNLVMGSVVPSLLTDQAKARADGYLWGMMRNGRGLMASYNRIPEMDRWDVVNYIRGLQGRYPVVTGAVGFPGQTGSALPGHSLVGPTVPSVYTRPGTAGITPRSGGHE